MSIIIVGNGTSVLEKTNGDKINSFDKVLRFNGFKIKGFEKNVGTKTNIWFTVNHAHMNQVNIFDEVIVHSWEWDRNKCRIFQDFIKKRSDCIKTEREFVRGKINLASPSSGIIAIFMMLERFDKVTITGFDWWDREEHHYGDEERRGTLHKPEQEHRIIKELMQQDKVVFLD